MDDALLSVQDLSVDYPGKGFRAKPNRVVHNVSLDVPAGRTLGLVGESGSGKSTVGRAILGLAPATEGSVVFAGRDITSASRRTRKQLARDIQVVFQDPYTSLNPSMTVGDILTEPLAAQNIRAADARKRIRLLLDEVRLPSDSINRLPREFSGGQRQRVAIARALALQPKLIICDEPVSALDLSSQSRILDLLLEIQWETNVSYLFISHDLDVVRHLSHRIAVLYRGQIVEEGTAADVTERPQDAYTRKLLLASPVMDPDEQARRRAKRHADAVAR